MTAGWIFRKGQFFVIVAEPDMNTAKKIAVEHFGGEPNSEPMEMDQNLADFFGAKRGQFGTAGVFQSRKI